MNLGNEESEYDLPYLQSTVPFSSKLGNAALEQLH